MAVDARVRHVSRVRVVAVCLKKLLMSFICRTL